MAQSVRSGSDAANSMSGSAPAVSAALAERPASLAIVGQNANTGRAAGPVIGIYQQGVFANGIPIVIKQNGTIVSVYAADGSTLLSGTSDVSALDIYGGCFSGGYLMGYTGGDTSVTVESGTLSGAIYGGNYNGGTVTGDSYITIKGGTINGNIFGGCNWAGGVSGTSNVTFETGATINGWVFGGGRVAGTTIGSTSVTINGGTFAHNVHGGGAEGSVTGDTHMTVKGGTVNGHIYGGSEGSGAVGGNTHIAVTGGTVNNNLYGGSLKNGEISGNTEIIVSGGYVKSIFGGNRRSGKVVGNTNITIENGATVDGWVYGGGAGTDDTAITQVCGSANITINGGNIAHNVYGSGGWRGATVKDANITVNGGAVAGYVNGGGEEKSSVTGLAKITVNDGRVGEISGAGAGFDNTAAMVANVDITVTGGTINSITMARGSYYPAAVTGSATLTLKNVSVFSDAWGHDADENQTEAACKTKLVLEGFGSASQFMEVGGIYANTKYPTGNSSTGFQTLEIKDSYLRVSHAASMSERFMLTSGVLWLDASWQEIPAIIGNGGTLWVTENMNVSPFKTSGNFAATVVTAAGNAPLSWKSVIFYVTDKAKAQAAVTSSNPQREILINDVESTGYIWYYSTFSSLSFTKVSEDASMVYGEESPTFSVEVSRKDGGSGQITYQWYYGYVPEQSTPITGAESSSYTPLVDINHYASGTYPFICAATYNGTTNYSRTMLLKVDKAPLTVVLATPPVFDGSAHIPQYTLSGMKTGESGLNLIINSTDTMVNAGGYPITARIPNGYWNVRYTLTNPNLTFTIAPKPVTAVVTTHDKAYDGSDAAAVDAVVGTEQGVLVGDSVTITGLTGQFDSANVGQNKPVTVNGQSGTITGTNSGNYAVEYPTDITADITSVTLNVTADPQRKKYGQIDPALTYSANGWVGADTASLLTGTLARDAGEEAGQTYPITQGTLSAGENYTISYTQALLTIEKADVTLRISSDLASAAPGATITFSVEAVNREASLAESGWTQPDGVTLSSPDGALSLSAASGQAGRYAASYVIPTTAAVGSSLTFTASVADTTGNYNLPPEQRTEVAVIVALEAPTITTQPSDAAIIAGSMATFTAQATGNPAPSYQWQVSTDNGANWSNVTGGTSASYTTPTATAAMNGYQYRCVASNGVSPDAVSNAAILTIISTPSITAQPKDQNATVGQQATFTIAATGDRLTYQWYINRGDGLDWLKLDNAAGTSHTTTPVTLENDGYRYFCRVTDAHGQTVDSGVAILHVSKVIIPPKTGDSATPLLWLGLCLLGGAGLLTLMLYRKRRA